MKKKISESLRALGLDGINFRNFSDLKAEFNFLRKEYLKKSHATHPDKGGDAEEFRNINENFEFLKNLIKKNRIATLAGTSAQHQEYEFTSQQHGEIPSYEYYEEAAQQDIPYSRVEYAKSGRDKCFATKMSEVCGEKYEKVLMEKDEVRVGWLDQDSGIYRGRDHLRCWSGPVDLKKPPPATITDFSAGYNGNGLALLKQESAAPVSKKRHAAIEADPLSAKPTKRARKVARKKKAPPPSAAGKENWNPTNVKHDPSNASNAKNLADNADTDYSKMTCVLLRFILKERRLQVSGKKATLIARLEENDQTLKETQSHPPLLVPLQQQQPQYPKPSQPMPYHHPQVMWQNAMNHQSSKPSALYPPSVFTHSTKNYPYQPTLTSNPANQPAFGIPKHNMPSGGWQSYDNFATMSGPMNGISMTGGGFPLHTYMGPFLDQHPMPSQQQEQQYRHSI